jgi:oligosaccharide repeat unit polymerase
VLFPLLFLFGFVLYLRAVDHVFGLETLVTNPGSVRGQQDSDAFLATFSLPVRLCYFLGPFVFFCYANPKISGIRVPRLVRWTVLLLILGSLIMSLGRTLPFVALFWAGLAALMTTDRSKDRRGFLRRHAVIVVACAVSALVIFQLLGSFLGKLGRNDPRFQEYVTSGKMDGSPLTSLVVYATGGIPAFNRLVTDPATKFGYGTHTFAPLLRVIPVVRPAKEIGDFVNIPFPTNSYTWFEPYYRDFGAAGVLVFSLLTGCAIVWLMHRSRSSNTWLAAASLVVSLSVWGPFVNKYPSSFTWEYLGLLLVVNYCARDRRDTCLLPAGWRHGHTGAPTKLLGSIPDL